MPRVFWMIFCCYLIITKCSTRKLSSRPTIRNVHWIIQIGNLESQLGVMIVHSNLLKEECILFRTDIGCLLLFVENAVCKSTFIIRHYYYLITKRQNDSYKFRELCHLLSQLYILKARTDVVLSVFWKCDKQAVGLSVVSDKENLSLEIYRLDVIRRVLLLALKRECEKSIRSLCFYLLE